MAFLAIILIIGSIVLAGAVAYLGVYLYSARRVKIESVQIGSLSEFDLEGFTLDSVVTVKNDGFVPVGFNRLDYDVKVDENKLTNGAVPGRTLPPHQSVSFKIHERIDWAPAEDLVMDLLEAGKDYAVIKGHVHIFDWKFIELKVPFEKKIDLEPYLDLFVPTAIERGVSRFLDVAGRAARAVITAVA